MTVEKLSDNITVYLGDNREILPSLLGLETVITDPPYGMAFRSNYREVKHLEIQNDLDTEALKWACNLSVSHSLYCFARWENLRDAPKPKSVLTWVKNNWSMGDLEHEHGRQTEIILFFPGPQHRWPKSRPTDIVKSVRTGDNFHPTEKPIDLMEQLVSYTLGTVTDPFMGSGTTGIACARLGRKFIGIEIERKYYDIALKRISEALKQGDLFR